MDSVRLGFVSTAGGFRSLSGRYAFNAMIYNFVYNVESNFPFPVGEDCQ